MFDFIEQRVASTKDADFALRTVANRVRRIDLDRRITLAER
jgi:hypothetical protein